MNIKSSLPELALALGLLALTLAAGCTGSVAWAQATAQTWYVDGNCIACGNGTANSPFSTINQALNSAVDGDTILVAQGTYTEHLLINAQVTLMGGYATTSPTWTRDVARYETVVVSDDRTVPGDWDGDWLGSSSVVKDGNTYRMWYSGGNEIDGERIGYADSPDGINWFKLLSGPLLETGPLGTWDEAGVADPAVLVTDNDLQMWYVGLDVTGQRAIGHATSPDGLTWRKYDGNPILRPDTADMASFGFPTAVQDGPNDYKMWYSGGGNIWLATSSDGLAWTKYLSTPALAPGSPGAWDDDQVYAPYVVTASGRYEMWYVGEGMTTSGPRIGYAWSENGLNWTKSPDNPVLSGATGTWEEEESVYPAVIKEGVTDYRMWYRAGGGGHAFGQATSSDGVTWAKYGGNPTMNQGKSTYWGSSVVFFGASGDGAVLDGLTITGGYAEYGGGIGIYQSSPTIRNCVVTGNVAQNGGGGIWLGDGTPLIDNTVVSSNTSAHDGGGISISYASPTIRGSVIEGNVAMYDGGGLLMRGPSQPILIATSIAGNAARRGGGLVTGDNVNLRVDGCIIDGNVADQAAGMQIAYSTLTMTNTLVLDNHATASSPGAMRFWRSSGRLINVTIANSSASDGPGGIAFAADQADKSLVILNSILFFNGGDDLSRSGGTCSVTYSDVQEGIAGSGNISADPRFVDRARGDYHLRGNSPAVDAGTDGGAPPTDFEGDPRPVGGVDMGADEFSGELIFLPLVLRSA